MLERLDQRPTWLLGQAHRRSHALLQEAFARAGARPYGYRLLAALEQHGPLSQADAGRHTVLDRSDVSATLDELEARRLVERAPDPADGRRKIASLTRAGAAELRRLDGVLDEIQDAVLAPLTARERTELARILTKLAGA